MQHTIETSTATRIPEAGLGLAYLAGFARGLERSDERLFEIEKTRHSRRAVVSISDVPMHSIDRVDGVSTMDGSIAKQAWPQNSRSRLCG